MIEVKINKALQSNLVTLNRSYIGYLVRAFEQECLVTYNGLTSIVNPEWTFSVNWVTSPKVNVEIIGRVTKMTIEVSA